MKRIIATVAVFFVSHLAALAAEVFTSGPGWLSFEGGKGPGAGKHVVLMAGDEEYRSEESMPMLARILSERHGFKCTVIFSHDDGVINPNSQKTMGKPEALDSADALVLGLRFRNFETATMAKFDGAVKRGIPIIATRTSTHAFGGIAKDSPFVAYNWNNQGGFGKNVLGETWVSHWGHHKFEATRTAVEADNASHPILQGVGAIFGDTDVYEAHPPADAKILLRGLVLTGMKADDQPSSLKKMRSTDKAEQGVNEPAMAVAWVREVPNASGSKNKILCTTMGAATDLSDESLRRLLVNGVFWGLGLAVPAKADVTPLVEWKPSHYSNNLFHPNFKAADFVGVLPEPLTAAPPAAKKKPAGK
ncbi:MAG: hypothetical protein EBQ59_05755 [Verrucomicrobia bacterium]|nr:hypothetical protein [Verrucomicrobiota bacterium]